MVPERKLQCNLNSEFLSKNNLIDFKIQLFPVFKPTEIILG